MRHANYYDKKQGTVVNDEYNQNSENLILEHFCERFSKIAYVSLDKTGKIRGCNSWFLRMCGLTELPETATVSSLLDIAAQPLLSIEFQPEEKLQTQRFTARPRNKQPSIEYQGIAIRYSEVQTLFFRNKLDEADKVLETVTDLNMEISALAVKSSSFYLH